MVLDDHFPVFRMDIFEKRLGFQRIFGVSRNFRDRRIGKFKQTVLGNDDALIGIINDQTIFFFRFQQRLFSLCALNGSTEDIRRCFEGFDFNRRPLPCRPAIVEANESPPFITDEYRGDYN
jgi:hypothetical protein